MKNASAFVSEVANLPAEQIYRHQSTVADEKDGKKCKFQWLYNLKSIILWTSYGNGTYHNSLLPTILTCAWILHKTMVMTVAAVKMKNLVYMIKWIFLLLFPSFHWKIQTHILWSNYGLFLNMHTNMLPRYVFHCFKGILFPLSLSFFPKLHDIVLHNKPLNKNNLMSIFVIQKKRKKVIWNTHTHRCKLI